MADILTSATNAVNSSGQAVTAVSNLASAVMNADDLNSLVRSCVIPAAAESVAEAITDVATFFGGGSSSADDWRVRLSLPKWTSFSTSPVLAPLKSAGGLIFPYTPKITIKQTAKYSALNPMHSNYGFHAFQSSDPGTITITAPMNVEDSTQAQYWVGALHYLRSMTKMFSGYDAKAGNPPPIVFLNGYGNYVFNNIPVVVTGFDVTLDNECDYISCDVKGSIAGGIVDMATGFGNLAEAIGANIEDLQGVSSTIVTAAGGVAQLGNMLGALGLGGSTSAGKTHVPTKSSFSVTLQPMYSRDSVRNFSLDTFVSGGYLKGGFGYI